MTWSSLRVKRAETALERMQLNPVDLPTNRSSEVLVDYTDIVLKCRECEREFVFTAGEQEFYASRGLMNQPGRCPECRSLRRQRMGQGGGYGSDDRARPQREMHPAVCAECGAQTMVPFLPRNDKPVYCSTCYDRVRARH